MGLTGIDPDSWRVTILPLPKRFSRGTALGFCGGHPVGWAETARAKSLGCWWPGGKPEVLALACYKEVATGGANGNAIPGQWRKSTTAAMGAVVWSLRDGRLVGTDLHDPSYESTWAIGAGGGAIVGVGSTPHPPGQKAHKIGLVWREGAKPMVVAGAGDVLLFTTDGVRLAGSIDGRATLWPSATAAPIDLARMRMPANGFSSLVS